MRGLASVPSEAADNVLSLAKSAADHRETVAGIPSIELLSRTEPGSPSCLGLRMRRYADG